MSASWHSQDKSLWLSCRPENHAKAELWLKNAAQHFSALQTLAAQQPLTGIDPAGLQQCRAEAAALRLKTDRLVVVGTGGASLGAQALCALAERPSRVRFLQNCDPVTLERFLHYPPDKTAWCIISKSGETVETLAAALALVGHVAAGGLRDNVRVITAAPNSTLAQLAQAQGWKILTHPATLGGRFSVFSLVGLLPAAYAGLPVEEIAQAAVTAMRNGLQQKDVSLLPHAAWLAANLQDKPMHVLMAYADRLRAATQWYKQLWAESLGKDGRGATPVTAIGALDQHSQLQLYLDGPRDKLVTLWLPETQGVGAMLPPSPIAGAGFLQGCRMGDVMQATAEATVTTLTAARVPLRVLRGTLTPQSLAAWMARQMLETLLVAHFIGVDPYSQPAVESGKKLTRAALAEAI